MPTPASVTLLLTGDVMTGRGIDQILRQPSQPVLYESYMQDARDYVRLAESVNGPIPAAWAAAPQHPGVARLPDLSHATAQRLADQLTRQRRSVTLRTG